MKSAPGIRGRFSTERFLRCSFACACCVHVLTEFLKDICKVIKRILARCFIGLGATGHVALTAANGFVLHDGAHTSTNRLYLPNYQGPISCIGTTAGSPLQILEILR